MHPESVHQAPALRQEAEPAVHERGASTSSDIVQRLRMAARTEINDHPGSQPDTPEKHRFIERFFAMIDGADEIARLRAREDELSRICAMSYQVIGSLLDDLGQFGTGVGTKILDNLSQQKLVHDDVLPWPPLKAVRRSVYASLTTKAITAAVDSLLRAGKAATTTAIRESLAADGIPMPSDANFRITKALSRTGRYKGNRTTGWTLRSSSEP